MTIAIFMVERVGSVVLNPIAGAGIRMETVSVWELTMARAGITVLIPALVSRPRNALLGALPSALSIKRRQP